MPIVRSSKAVWEGNLREGQGKIDFGSGAYHGPYSFKDRFESGTGTNPEELIAAAHAGCFSMALSNELTKAGTPPKKITTTARVQLDQVTNGFEITHIYLETEAEIPGLDNAKFLEIAEGAKKGCPVSKVLAGAKIHLNAKLVS
jgi:osmotically inducible protein OsmC